MPKLTAGPNVSGTYQFGWNPVIYEQHLKTPEGKAEFTAIQQKVAEQIYLEQEEIQKFLRWLQSQMAPDDQFDEETSRQTKESSHAFWEEEEETKRTDEKSDSDEDSKMLDELLKRQEESLRKADQLDRYIQSHVASLDKDTQQHSHANEQDLDTIYSQKRGDAYSITEYEYHIASRRTTLAEVNQAEKLAALQQREGVAWLCEYEAKKIRQTIVPIKDRLLTLPLNSPERQELEAQIAQAENLAAMKENKALKIREELAIERENVNHTLESIHRDEARWDMAAAQSGVHMNPEEHAAQVARRNQMLQGIQNRSALRSPAEREAARREAVQNEVLRNLAEPAPPAPAPARRWPTPSPSPMQRVREEQQQRITDPYGARNIPAMTREQALNVLGISPEQWNSLPPDTSPSERKDTGEIQDKGDLLVESQISKSQLYTDYKIQGNREKQGEIQKAYQVLDNEISAEIKAVSAQKAQPSPVAPQQQAGGPAAFPETSAAQQKPVVESSAPTPITPVDAPAQAQLRPVPSAPAWQRRMDDRERQAIAATIDKNSQAQSRFYNGNLAQQRAVVDEQYQQAIQQHERATIDLAKATQNPTKSSALANQQDREYLASVEKEAADRVKHYETLANYYGIEPKPQSQSQLQPEPEPAIQEQPPAPAPESANQLSREEMRQARLKKIAESEATQLSIDPAKASLSLKSLDPLNVESPDQRQQRFSDIVPGKESTVIPHTQEDGYYVQIGEENVLDVTEEPLRGEFSADFFYNKNSLSEDDVANLMTETCRSAGVGPNSVATVSGDASEEVQEALTNEGLFANVTTKSSSEEENSSTLPFKQKPTYSSGGSDDDDDYDDSTYFNPQPKPITSSSGG